MRLETADTLPLVLNVFWAHMKQQWDLTGLPSAYVSANMPHSYLDF